MRPNAPGTILDASALIALPRSIYARTMVDFSVREGRPLIIPAASLYAAALAGIAPETFDADGYTVTPVSQSTVPGMAALASTATGDIGIDYVQVAWEAQVTGYPVLTDNPGPYAYLNVPIDLELI
ncbi:hypothetical protein [Nocardia brasiliensis]|uniref:hypothetical protein n=1 Tax=Nocardia brasiliensis TaxID=37326 RepID=UPI00245452CE|nr:hypothetical protein [Nocardia brasiliensis]